MRRPHTFTNPPFAVGPLSPQAHHSPAQFRVDKRCDLLRHVCVPRVVGVHAVRADQAGRADEPAFGDRIDPGCAPRRAPRVEHVANLQHGTGDVGGRPRRPDHQQPRGRRNAARQTKVPRAFSANAAGSTPWSLREPKNTTNASLGPDRPGGQIARRRCRDHRGRRTRPRPRRPRRRATRKPCRASVCHARAVQTCGPGRPRRCRWCTSRRSPRRGSA